MTIRTKRETGYIEVLPSILIGWEGGFEIYLGWLFWNVIIRL